MDSTPAIEGDMLRGTALLIALSLLAAACAGTNGSSVDETSTTADGGVSVATSTSATTSAPETTSSTSATTTSSTGAPDSGVSDTASPLVVVAIDFAAGFILIRNDGDEDYDLGGHWLCNRPTYSQLPDEVLAPGDVVEIEASAVGLNADGGELALYTSRDFSNADDIIRYVQWGTDSHGRTATAVAGGIWQMGDFVDNQGGNLDSVGSDPVSAADWSSS